MEIKAKLLKPYTDKERTDFYFDYGQNCFGKNPQNYEIRETEEALEAWGYTEEELSLQEEEYVAKLTMTALDFINFLRSCGIQLASIRQFLDNNLELDTQLKYCQNVYCQVAESVMPIEVDGVTITAEMVRQAFINKAKGV